MAWYPQGDGGRTPSVNRPSFGRVGPAQGGGGGFWRGGEESSSEFGALFGLPPHLFARTVEGRAAFDPPPATSRSSDSLPDLIDWMDAPPIPPPVPPAGRVTRMQRTEGRCYVCNGIRPVVVEEGHDPVCVECGQTFVELGVSASDFGDADFGAAGPLPALFNMMLAPLMDRDYFQGPNGRFQSLGSILGAFLTALNEENFNNVLHHIMQNDPNKYGPPPAAEDVRRALPREELTPTTAEGDCAVCQEPFKAGEIGTRLTRDRNECGHMFHDHCLIPWLEAHNTCPVCRYELPTDDADYEARKAQVRGQLQRNLSQRPSLHLGTDSSQPRPEQRAVSTTIRQSPLASLAGRHYVSTSHANTMPGQRRLDNARPSPPQYWAPVSRPPAGSQPAPPRQAASGTLARFPIGPAYDWMMGPDNAQNPSNHQHPNHQRHRRC
eukprot:Gregarina_sp_Pseudo_9__4950@NODE_518_length_2656_cov_20_155139_g489_i0_p1_GENE_NODE_518_length_2656_cov_20_155139_g489_i0NODE_518_length_2656_cov_20_155139_g489_i0_p1_ORF_typecomplete_len437_score72_09zfRING_2/PF13639_6/2_3e03zfRING_2/PF13639_6/7_6e14zfrbx1/PF12678_7/6_1e11zfANAPC11/PF12861_7/7e03zfANAPC11/PF12861_7/6_9e09zfC3HC4_2/PF13923_6/5_3e02zfC3HC4_2/PF13923_6/9_8e09zfC3HC4/PF00097_25/1_4e03zfC3HC4/PF00097_25/4_4e07zfRING_5/PF14634_6/1_6e03zfRING_5/PF14634_6/5_4e03zfRING_5/PF14634_6/6e06F